MSRLSASSEMRRARLLKQVRAEAKNLPGVYQMLSGTGEVLYVGKSRQVRTRLLSYFRATAEEKGWRIVEEAEEIRWTYAPNEFQALLSEMEAIKRLRPRYNVRLKRDRRFSFLKLSAAPAPKIQVLAEVREDSGRYYGPFRGGHRIQEAVRELSDVLGLRDCALSVPMHFSDQPDLFPLQRTPGCHRAEVGLCLAPCAALTSEAEYQRRVELAEGFLRGEAEEPLSWLEERMARAAGEWNFELAARLRDRRERLQALREEFRQMREALDELSFVYPLAGTDGETLLYLIRRGRVRATAPLPQGLRERRRLERLVESVFQAPENPHSPVAPHQIEEILLVAHWFRTHPAERARTLPPESYLPLQQAS